MRALHRIFNKTRHASAHPGGLLKHRERYTRRDVEVVSSAPSVAWPRSKDVTEHALCLQPNFER